MRLSPLRRGLRRAALAAMLVLSGAGAAGAADILFDCTIPRPQNTYYQPGHISVRVHPATLQAWVDDPLVRATAGAPVEAEIETGRGDTLTVLWVIRNVTPDPRQRGIGSLERNIPQRLVIRGDGKALLLSQSPGGSYAERRIELRAEGTCLTRK